MRYNFRIRKDEYIDDYVVDMKWILLLMKILP